MAIPIPPGGFSPLRKTIVVAERQQQIFKDRVQAVVDEFMEQVVQGGDPAYLDMLEPLAKALGTTLDTLAGAARDRIREREEECTSDDT